MHLVWLNKAKVYPETFKTGHQTPKITRVLVSLCFIYCFVFRPMTFASFVAQFEYVEGTGRGFSKVSISSPERIGNASKRQDVAS